LVFDLIGIDKDELTEEQIQYIRTGFRQAFDEDFAWGFLDKFFKTNYDILYGDNYYYNLGKISTHNAVLSLNAASMEISKQGAGLNYLTGLGAAEKIVTFTRVTASGGSAVISSSNAVVISEAISTTISSSSDVCIAAVSEVAE
ncbi:MAG: hypothetical protein MJA31_17470, partial [Clostridia bacterium]|nr:hypothetical protein [Clostridia bacterium]